MIDFCIVLTYLIGTIIVGFWYGRNIKSMRDYSVADRVFPTAALVATIFATWIGGDDLTLEGEYTAGFIFCFIWCSQFISLAMHAYVIAPKILRDFEEKISIGEIMGELYGDIGQVITGISSVLFSLGYIAVQIGVIGYVCNFFFGISHIYGAMIGSVIVISYSAFGGVRSVVFTDVLQFGVLIVAIPLMANFLLSDIGGIEELLKQLPDSHKTIDVHGEDFMSHLAMIAVCVFPFFNPMMIQRILMSKDIKQANDAFMTAGLLFIPYYISLLVIAVVAVVKFPGLNPAIVFMHSLHYALPPILKGFAISGFFAVVMSTADSHLNTASIATVRDIAVILFPKISDKTQLRLARFTTIMIGFCSVYVAMCFTRILDFFLYFSNFWTATVVAPMVLYMFNIITNPKHYAMSVVVGVASIVICRSIYTEGAMNILSSLIGMCFTIFSMLGFYYLKKSRSQIIKI